VIAAPVSFCRGGFGTRPYDIAESTGQGKNHERTNIMTFSNLFFALDAWFIAPFRWISPAQTGFIVGTIVLAVQSFVAGRLCLLILNKAQGRLRNQYDVELNERQQLSFQAISTQNKTAYLAQNDLAQVAYGRSMSLAMGRLCASLWPAVMSLAWMKSRFSDAPLPLALPFTDKSVNVSYIVVFILFYLGIRIIFNRISHHEHTLICWKDYICRK
jgi:hypothetical protein